MRAAGLLVVYAILSHPERLLTFLPRGMNRFTGGTLILVAINAALLATFRRSEPSVADDAVRLPWLRRGAAVVAAAASIDYLLLSARALIVPIFTTDLDPNRADMLVLIREGLKAVVQGQNPYQMYHVPWEAPLSYGPMLWLPYLIPWLALADLRVITAFGQLFVPVLGAIAGTVAISRGRIVIGLGLIAVAVAPLTDPEYVAFTLIGHTPAYWPLLALFVVLAADGRHRVLTAVLLGLLVCARTTMMALVPVFLVNDLLRHREHRVRVAIALAISALGPFVPFFVANPRMLIYAMYGVYQHTIQGFVWHSTTWAVTTFGVTGMLLRAGHEDAVQIVQVFVMLVVYSLAWLDLRRGGSVLAWLAAALLAFSMTTLWPVNYIYYDVFLMIASGFIAEELAIGGPRLSRIAALFAGAALVTVTILALGMARSPGSTYQIVAGDPDVRWNLRSGFGPNESEGGQPFAWATRAHVYVRLPRAARWSTTISIEMEPFVPEGGGDQRVAATLNEVPLAEQRLVPGWQVVTFRAPSRAWRIGHNQLRLDFAYVASERAARLRRIVVGATP